MKSLFKLPVLINAALFQITWFACVIGSAQGLIWPAVLACLALAVYQLQPARRHPTDLKLIALSIGLGIIVDSIWIQSGLMVFTDARPLSQFAPVWIILLWVGFALTVNHSLGWLSAHPMLPALMGMIGGPLSYLAGLKLGAVVFHGSTILICACLAFAWGLSLSILVKVSKTPKQAIN